jgi:LmbE family N-acetylglucosaminyl deacetylase
VKRIDPTSISRALFVAPHPDDESLGCGGLLTILARQRCEIVVLFVTDGGASHLHSRSWSRQRLAAQRRAEANAALSELGLAEHQRLFLNLRDADMPVPGCMEWCNAVACLSEIMERLQPDLVVLPWRRDPHCDHRASWQLMQEALGKARPMILEYAVWLDELGSPDDKPQAGEADPIAIDIRQAVASKKRAIAAHLSQTSALINDDPDGFRLSRDTIERLTGPVEYYWQGRYAPN